MDSRHIIMNFTVPPCLEDLQALAETVWDMLPDELLHHCEGAEILIEDIADDITVDDLELDSPFDLLALYKSGREISPGLERKTAEGEGALVLYRRSLLDMWCETEDDLQSVLRQIMIEELGRYFEFTDDDIQSMIERHHQGLL